MDIPKKAIQNHKMRYQCFHPTVKTSNAVRPRALFEENFYDRRISSGHTEREVQFRMFASYKSLGVAFLCSFRDKLLHK